MNCLCKRKGVFVRNRSPHRNVKVFPMSDTLSKSDRSQRMSLIRATDTKPELVVRRLTHRLGYRYRLHVRGLSGTPDMVLKSRRSVIFVHGCFWHRHEGCRSARLPKSNLDYWEAKLEGNRQRDARNIQLLKKDGWRSLIIWECETKDYAKLARRITQFLEVPAKIRNSS